MKVPIPSKCIPFFGKEGGAWRGSRYKVLRGGRGGAKSWTFARILASRSAYEPLRILCTREMQNSIADSVHRLLRDQIYSLGLSGRFDITQNSIRSSARSEFIFKGLRHNINEIKSLEGIDICWVEEAEKVSNDSWNILIPTIRKDNSEIWVSYNPEDEHSSTNTRFYLNPPPDCLTLDMNWRDLGTFFPEVLRREMEYDRRVDPEKYEHIWEGKYKRYAEALIMRGKFKIEPFETPDKVHLMFGADFGFSVDPTVLLRCFIQGNKLFIDYEAYGHGVEIDQLEAFFLTVPESRREKGGPKWQIRADSERPDTIAYLKRRGFNIIGATKGPGSVEDGIQFLRSFEEVIIHPRCKGTIGDYQNWKWKTDKITGQVLPIPLEASDHAPDSTRYALEPYIKKKTTIYDALSRGRT